MKQAVKKQNKYTYLAVIQQYFTGSYGWEDVSEYETDSQGNCKVKSGSFVTLKNGYKRELSALAHDLKEYRLMGYPTRVIHRKELNPSL